MPANVSPTTGEMYYSGPWTSIREILSILDIGEGKLAKVTMQMVSDYQEMIDRDIDSQMQELYHVPLRAMNQVQPDGTTKRVFPGDITRLARYWTAGLILLNEFQQLAQNVTEQASGYVTDAQKQLHKIILMNHRLLGQERKSNISRTMPPNLQPAQLPEPQW